MVKTIFAFLVIIVVVFLSPVNLVFAQANNSSGSVPIVEVDRVANLRDRLWERITLFFKFSNSDKAEYEKYLVQKRFAELRYVIDVGQGDMIEETSSRYSTYLGRLTDFVVKNKLVGEKEEILKTFDSHLPVLEDLSREQEYESGFWLLLQHDINYLRLYRDQIKNLN